MGLREYSECLVLRRTGTEDDGGACGPLANVRYEWDRRYPWVLEHEGMGPCVVKPVTRLVRINHCLCSIF